MKRPMPTGIFCSTSARTALHAARGKIVNVGAYGASKATVIRMTESMAAELREQGININCVLPTTLDTPQIVLIYQLPTQRAGSHRKRLPK